MKNKIALRKARMFFEVMLCGVSLLHIRTIDQRKKINVKADFPVHGVGIVLLIKNFCFYSKPLFFRPISNVSEKSWKTLKQKLKFITRKTTPSTLSERIQKLKEVQRGWINYFRMESIYGKLKDLDSWLRNRLRYCIWHDWKKPERKRKNLIRLGINKDQAYAWSRTRMEGWHVAQSPILINTITLKRLEKKGYESLPNYYLKVSPQLNEPLYTRTARTVV